MKPVEKDLCSETSLGGQEPKLNQSHLLCFIAARSRHAVHPSTFIHRVNWKEGMSPSTLLLWAGCQRCPPPIQTHTYTLTHTHTQIPGLASAQCWDYRIRTLFHYLLTLYSACTHTHTQCHTVLAKADTPKTDTVSIRADDFYRHDNRVTVSPHAGIKTTLCIIAAEIWSCCLRNSSARWRIRNNN